MTRIRPVADCSSCGSFVNSNDGPFFHAPTTRDFFDFKEIAVSKVYIQTFLDFGTGSFSYLNVCVCFTGTKVSSVSFYIRNTRRYFSNKRVGVAWVNGVIGKSITFVIKSERVSSVNKLNCARGYFALGVNRWISSRSFSCTSVAHIVQIAVVVYKLIRSVSGICCSVKCRTLHRLEVF